MLAAGDLARFVDKIEVSASGCWLWTAKLSPERYPYFKLAGRSVLAHRLAHEHWIGPIPEGHEVDHLCFNSPCVNPSHLEAVTPEENIERARRAGRLSLRPAVHPNAAKTHCRRSHPLAGDNLRVIQWRDKTMRQCKACGAMHSRSHRARIAAANP